MEQKSKYEAFFDHVERLNIRYLDVLMGSIGNKPSFLYNEDRKHLNLLIEFVSILEEGFTLSDEIAQTAKAEFFVWDDSCSDSLKQLLKSCERKDLQLAYILSMIRSLGLMSRDEFEKLVTNTALLISVNGDLKYIISDVILPKVIKHYLQTNDPQTRLQCIKLCIGCQYYGMQDFNPLNMEIVLTKVKESFPGFDRYTYQALATRDKAYTGYLQSLTQFGKKDSLTQISPDLKDSIHAFLGAANSFYLNPRTTQYDRDNCLGLVTEIYGITKKLDEISKSTSFDRLGFSDELNKLSRIGILIDRLEESAPRDSLNWLKISVASLLSAFILTISWVIPSLTCYGRNSFFRHVNPVIPRAQELVQRLENEIQSQLMVENPLESEQAALIID